MTALDLAAAGVLAGVDTMTPANGLSRVPVGALKDLARVLEEASPGLLARVAGDRAPAVLAALMPPPAARSRHLLDGYTGPDCAGCGDEIPTGTPPYPGDMEGNGRLCKPCERLTGATEYVPCSDCPDRLLFDAGEIEDHRKLAHPGETNGARN